MSEEILNYICESPDEKYGGFKREIVKAARWAKERIATLEAENKRLKQALRFDKPWSVLDIIEKLVEAGNYLLHDCNWDYDDWESIAHAIKGGEEWLLEARQEREEE